ncbi:unnamed protein product [Coregonus sp. 'balchen']|nr:unnamed protein product [Coregonus sp. 'balchen']
MVDNSGSSKAQMVSCFPLFGAVPWLAQYVTGEWSGGCLSSGRHGRRNEAGGRHGAAAAPAAGQAGDGAQGEEAPRGPHHVRPAGSSAAGHPGCGPGLWSWLHGQGPGGGGAGIPRGGPLSRVFNQSSVDSEREDEDRGRDSGDEDDDEEMMDGDEGSEEEEGGASGLEYLRKQTLALQQGASRLPAHPFGSYSTSGPQQAPLPPVRVKQEPDESRSPAGPHSATSPNGQAEWNSFDDQFKQQTNILLVFSYRYGNVIQAFWMDSYY